MLKCNGRSYSAASASSSSPLLITVNDSWLAQHKIFNTLGQLLRQPAHHRIPADLLLYSQSQVEERHHWLGYVIDRPYCEGRVLVREELFDDFEIWSSGLF